MSSVLIGIIGVILFIGLAIAGASFLGTDFMTASASSRAAAVVSHMNQIAQGVQVLQARRGVTLPSSTGSNIGQTLISYKALKDVPVNPVLPGSAYVATNATGGQDATQARLVYTDLGTGQRARNVCFAIEEQAGNPSAAGVVDTPTSFGPRATAAPRVGCIMDSDLSSHYVAYAPI